jgi:large subunit ribosomal protein L4
MASITLKTPGGAEAGDIELDEAIFGIEPNQPVMHQVVTAQLAARRSGTQSTKTRSEVRGGGAKPWKQKGTGRARQGSIRSPQWIGGGIALGPKPRSYAQRTPKKMIRLALRSALSDRAAEDKVVVVDDWGFDAPSTKAAVAALSALELAGRVLLVLNADDVVTWKSFRNLDSVHILEAGQLNAYDVLCSDYVVFSSGTLPTADGEAPARSAATRVAKTAAKKSAVKKKAANASSASKVQAETDEPETDGSSGEADDMNDLPNRPPKDPSKKKSTIKATDRVKSSADKPDPRFEAARQKSAKEDALRSKAEKAQESKADAEAHSHDDEAAEATAAPEKAGSFSFSNTEEDKK